MREFRQVCTADLDDYVRWLTVEGSAAQEKIPPSYLEGIGAGTTQGRSGQNRPEGTLPRQGAGTGRPGSSPPPTSRTPGRWLRRQRARFRGDELTPTDHPPGNAGLRDASRHSSAFPDPLGQPGGLRRLVLPLRQRRARARSGARAAGSGEPAVGEEAPPEAAGSWVASERSSFER